MHYALSSPWKIGIGLSWQTLPSRLQDSAKLVQNDLVEWADIYLRLTVESTKLLADHNLHVH